MAMTKSTKVTLKIDDKLDAQLNYCSVVLTHHLTSVHIGLSPNDAVQLAGAILDYYEEIGYEVFK